MVDQELLDKLSPEWYRLGMTTRSIRFPRELLDRLDKEADKMELSTNWLIMKLCQEGLDRLESELRITKDISLR